MTQFTILSLQKHVDAVDIQVSAFNRVSTLGFTPDALGDLLFNGIAQYAARSDTAFGVQTDASWKIDDRHTLRTGFQVQGERTTFNTNSAVLPVDSTGAQTSDQPIGDAGQHGEGRACGSTSSTSAMPSTRFATAPAWASVRRNTGCAARSLPDSPSGSDVPVATPDPVRRGPSATHAPAHSVGEHCTPVGSVVAAPELSTT